MNQTIQTQEYGCFLRGKTKKGYVALTESAFDALEQFALKNAAANREDEEILRVFVRPGIGKVIQVRNFVGLLRLKEGTCIEIMPKVYTGDQENVEELKKLLIEMLRVLRDAPYQNVQTAQLDTAKMPLMEIFIRMFTQEVFRVVKRGLKSDYGTVEENAAYYKGKMLFSQQIRSNYIHKEKNYVEYDQFQLDCPENRIIRATLKYVYLQTQSMKTKSDIQMLLAHFGEVSDSMNPLGEFGDVVPDRNNRDYEKALKWCEIFLKGRSFTSFSGSEVAFALLFPMETLFEDYVAAMLKRVLDPRRYTLSPQDGRYFLFDRPKRFAMRPDLVVTDKTTGQVYVMDTKWKILKKGEWNYGIKSADMYQMYAYQKKYQAENVTLLYPKTEKVPQGWNIEYQSRDAAHVRAWFVDLFDMRRSLGEIVGEVLR